MGHQREVTPKEFLLILRGMALAWGGDILKVSQKEYNAILDQTREVTQETAIVYDAPFVLKSRLGVHWGKKQVLYTSTPHFFEVIHEMGHIFACTQNPEDSEEYDFLGWEIAMVAQIGADRAIWARYNRKYQVEYGWTIGDLSKEEKEDLFQERIQAAEALGLIKNGVPLAIR